MGCFKNAVHHQLDKFAGSGVTVYWRASKPEGLTVRSSVMVAPVISKKQRLLTTRYDMFHASMNDLHFLGLCWSAWLQTRIQALNVQDELSKRSSVMTSKWLHHDRVANSQKKNE